MRMRFYASRTDRTDPRPRRLALYAGRERPETERPRVALFDENLTVGPAPKSPRRRGASVGTWSAMIALVLLLIMTFLPTAYVIQQPGPVYDTLGTSAGANGSQVPLISVSGAKTYPTDGALYLLTVQVVGNPQQSPSWMQLAAAWLDPSQAVLPTAAVFPDGQTVKQSDQQSAAMMVDSQKEATAAALRELGYTVTPRITVYSLTKDAAAAGRLRPGDVITAADGTAITSAATLQRIIGHGAGAPVHLTVDRSGTTRSITVTPRRQAVGGTPTWLIGVTLTTDFHFPVDVTLQLNNVGGPSAGMMFALGIIDTMTPRQLTGGHRIAGTGTIDAAGDVGAIGGIQQKMYGARDHGAQYFLAPAANCDQVVGHIPSGLRVFSVKTLGGALHALKAVRTGDGLSALPTCS